MLRFPVCRHTRSVLHCRRHPVTCEKASVEDAEGVEIRKTSVEVITWRRDRATGQTDREINDISSMLIILIE